MYSGIKGLKCAIALMTFLICIHCSLMLLFGFAAADFLGTWLEAKLQLRMHTWFRQIRSSCSRGVQISVAMKGRCTQTLWDLGWQNHTWQSRQKQRCDIKFPWMILFCFPPQRRTRKVSSECHWSWKWSRWEHLCCLQSALIPGHNPVIHFLVLVPALYPTPCRV